MATDGYAVLWGTYIMYIGILNGEIYMKSI